MAEGVEAVSGGILGLLDLIDQHGEAIEYDLISLGMRLRDLGTDKLSWRDLLVITRQAPRQSALARAAHGSDLAWGLTEHLLATAVDALNIANWQRGNEGRKSPSRKPKPVPRPGVKDTESTTVGADPIPMSEFDTWWERGGNHG